MTHGVRSTLWIVGYSVFAIVMLAVHQPWSIVIGAILAYSLPTFCAFMRKVAAKGQIVVVNYFLGWTLIGWVVALTMAFRDPKPEVQVHHHYAQGSAQVPPP